MNTSSRRLSVLLAPFVVTAAALVFFGLSAPASAKPAAARSATNHVVQGKRGVQPAIKVGRDQANKNPKRLSSGKPRSGILRIDNRTEYYVDIYANGSYSGTVAPYGDLYLHDSEDEAVVSGDVPGTSYSFGARTIGVPGVWRLDD